MSGKGRKSLNWKFLLFNLRQESLDRCVKGTQIAPQGNRTLIEAILFVAVVGMVVPAGHAAARETKLELHGALPLPQGVIAISINQSGASKAAMFHGA